MIVLACDPGDTTGWALYVDDQLAEFGQSHGMKDLLTQLKEFPKPDSVVVEDYRVRPGVNHNYSRVNTIQIIGALKAYALENDARYVLQEPSIKPIAYKWAGLVAPKNHALSHEFDAMAHGYYYLVRTNRRKPVLIENAERKKEANDL